jgi:hypothetical protein
MDKGLWYSKKRHLWKVSLEGVSDQQEISLRGVCHDRFSGVPRRIDCEGYVWRGILAAEGSLLLQKVIFFGSTNGLT